MKFVKSVAKCGNRDPVISVDWRLLLAWAKGANLLLKSVFTIAPSGPFDMMGMCWFVECSLGGRP